MKTAVTAIFVGTFYFLNSRSVWHTRPTCTPSVAHLYKRHRFPAERISPYVCLYFRFCPSYLDVEEVMAERGVLLTYKAVRYRRQKFGQAYANVLRRRRPRPDDKWRLDKVFLTIGNPSTRGCDPARPSGIALPVPPGWLAGMMGDFDESFLAATIGVAGWDLCLTGAHGLLAPP